jgi:hypothetical protein
VGNYERILGEVLHFIANSFTHGTAAVALIVILATAIGWSLARRATLASGTLGKMPLVRYIVPGVLVGPGNAPARPGAVGTTTWSSSRKSHAAPPKKKGCIAATP